jgi:phenylpropionate dioxygenase-like ring-hydroxylating dioxygenase large terminal subunit
MTDANTVVDEMTSLDPACYTTDAYFERERVTMWASSWVAVCRVEDVDSPGAFSTSIVAGDPVVVVRGNGHELRGFGNVCPHRNATIMEGAGSVRALQCPYHLWTFRLDGTLVAAPDMLQAIGFDPDEVCLPPVAVDTWNGWVFVNLDNAAAPLASQIAGLDQRVAPYHLDTLRQAGTIHCEQPWNWKITVENFSESYHHAAVHPQTLQVTYPGQKSWVEDNHEEPWLWLDHVSVDDESEPFAVAVAFPSHMFSIIRGLGMVWFRIEALGARETRLDVELFLPPELCDDEEIVAGVLDALREINDEDTLINDRVAVGLNSRWAVAGPTSHLERGCDQLRDWITEQVAAP